MRQAITLKNHLADYTQREQNELFGRFGLTQTQLKNLWRNVKKRKTDKAPKDRMAKKKKTTNAASSTGATGPITVFSIVRWKG